MTEKIFENIRGGRLVLGDALADIYHAEIPIYNVTSISNNLGLQDVVSGSILVSSFPASGIDFYNRDLGAIGAFDLSSSGISTYKKIYDIQYHRNNISISGSKLIGVI